MMIISIKKANARRTTSHLKKAFKVNEEDDNSVMKAILRTTMILTRVLRSPISSIDHHEEYKRKPHKWRLSSSRFLKSWRLNLRYEETKDSTVNVHMTSVEYWRHMKPSTRMMTLGPRGINFMNEDITVTISSRWR